VTGRFRFSIDPRGSEARDQGTNYQIIITIHEKLSFLENVFRRNDKRSLLGDMNKCDRELLCQSDINTSQTGSKRP